MDELIKYWWKETSEALMQKAHGSWPWRTMLLGAPGVFLCWSLRAREIKARWGKERGRGEELILRVHWRRGSLGWPEFGWQLMAFCSIVGSNRGSSNRFCAGRPGRASDDGHYFPLDNQRKALKEHTKG